MKTSFEPGLATFANDSSPYILGSKGPHYRLKLSQPKAQGGAGKRFNPLVHSLVQPGNNLLLKSYARKSYSTNNPPGVLVTRAGARYT